MCRMNLIGKPVIVLIMLSALGCAHIPDGIHAVTGFEPDRYLGKWYEIARLDHPFERGLTDVTAEYSLNQDGSIRVLNKGYNTQRESWSQAEGRAFLIGPDNVGRLKVSFFGPFYGGYNIIALDKEAYSYALVCGNNRSYLWILAREPQLDTEILHMLLQKAEELGFATQDLIFVTHDQSVNTQDE